MRIALLGLLLFVIALPLFILHVWAIIDVVRTPQSIWATAGQNELLWGILVLALSVVGLMRYLTIARPQLIAARSGGG